MTSTFEDALAAMRGGQLDTLNRILEAAPDVVHAADITGTTLLHWAVGATPAGPMLPRGDKTVKIVQALLRHGADPNRKSPTDVTPMRAAVSRGQVDVVKALMAAGADMSGADGGPTPLFVAAQHNQPELLKLLLPTSKPYVNQLNAEGLSPLTAAITSAANSMAVAQGGNELAVLTALLSAGADPNQLQGMAGEPKRRPLSHALRRGNIIMWSSPQRLIGALVTAGMRLNDEDEDGCGYLHACLTGHLAHTNNKTVTALLELGLLVNRISAVTGVPVFVSIMQLASMPHSSLNLLSLLQSCLAHGGDIRLGGTKSSLTVIDLMDTWPAGSPARAFLEQLLKHGDSVGQGDKLFAALQADDLAAAQAAIASESSCVNAMDTAGNTPLLMAVAANKPRFVALLLANGADPDKPNAAGRTPLFAALAFRDDPAKALLTALCKGGANPNILLTSNGQSPLFACATNIVLVKHLVSLGADINLQDKEGSTPLFLAFNAAWNTAQFDIKRQIQEFVALGAHINAQDKLGRTALSRFLASSMMHLAGPDVVDAFVLNGGNIHLPDHQGNPALYYACTSMISHRLLPVLLKRGGQADWVNPVSGVPLLVAVCELSSPPLAQIRTLIENGADVLACSRVGVSALTICKRWPPESECRKLIEFRVSQLSGGASGGASGAASKSDSKTQTSSDAVPSGLITELFEAISVADDAAVRRLVKRNVPVDCRSASGQPALCAAALAGCVSIARFLLEEGADPNATNLAGLSPLHIAVARAANQDMVKLLIRAGANVNLLSGSGCPPVFSALSPASVDSLIQGGADLSICSPTGTTPLWSHFSSHEWLTAEARRACNAEAVIRKLVQAGVNINHRDNKGGNALLNCFKSDSTFRHVMPVRLFAELGGDMNCIDNHNHSILYYAMACILTRTDMIQALLDCGADPTLLNATGQSPLLDFMLHSDRAAQLQPATVSLFLQAGVDIRVIDNTGHSILSAASRLNASSPCAKILAYAAQVFERMAQPSAPTAKSVTLAELQETVSKLGSASTTDGLVQILAELSVSAATAAPADYTAVLVSMVRHAKAVKAAGSPEWSQEVAICFGVCLQKIRQVHRPVAGAPTMMEELKLAEGADRPPSRGSDPDPDAEAAATSELEEDGDGSPRATSTSDDRPELGNNKEGLLFKLGRIWPSWKERWFVADSHGIGYYDPQDRSKQLGYLAAHTIQNVLPEGDADHVRFKVVTTERVLHCFASTPSLCSAWVADLQKRYLQAQ